MQLKVMELKRYQKSTKKPETVIGTSSRWGDNGGKGEIVAKILSYSVP